MQDRKGVKPDPHAAGDPEMEPLTLFRAFLIAVVLLAVAIVVASTPPYQGP